ncbi:MAG: glycoside hydrolase family 130 protein [Chloroflexota bacterium]
MPPSDLDVQTPVHTPVARPFALHRLAVLMEPNEHDPREAWGVLNPASARAPDGQLYLFPRLVAKGNYSRVGIARVLFDAVGDPVAVERLGVALEPTQAYEKNPVTGGGCEDPRISYVAALGQYVMSYTAFSPVGPRIAMAVSKDLFAWERLGLARFSSMKSHDLNAVDNKDAILFPSPVAHPDTGQPALALIHRPTFAGSPAYSFMDRWWDTSTAAAKPPRTSGAEVARPIEMVGRRLTHPSLWISYSQLGNGLADLCSFNSHRRLISPSRSWEREKVGAGPPPLLTSHGWLLLYHGVVYRAGHFRYSAGAVVLDRDNPGHVLYRTPRPILSPGADDQLGIVPDVVFPTAIDRRSDIGMPDRVDVYYGMADSRIGVATLTLPRVLELSPPGPPSRMERAVLAQPAAR